jgi:hypothetical protein
MDVRAQRRSAATALNAYEIFDDAMYQGWGQIEALPVAMMGLRLPEQAASDRRTDRRWLGEDRYRPPRFEPLALQARPR